MSVKIKHLAIVSSEHMQEGEFYATLFGMKKADPRRPGGAVTVRDGYVGLNINPRAPGRQAGFDHFGFEVEDAERVLARMREGYPDIRILKRLSNRPFAGISTHDPFGNVFDLSQEGMENRRDLYLEGENHQKRHVKHFMLRTVDPAKAAKFYRDVLELTDLEKPAGDPNFYLSDGRVTLVISPWNITDFEGSGIERPALDHIGFEVESVEAVKKELEALREQNSSFGSVAEDKRSERETRLKLLSKCPFGQYHFSDPDGVLIDIAEG